MKPTTPRPGAQKRWRFGMYRRPDQVATRPQNARHRRWPFGRYSLPG